MFLIVGRLRRCYLFGWLPDLSKRTRGIHIVVGCGAGDITGSYLSGKSDDEKYVYTHLAASYAYCGDLAFTGCPYELC